VKLYLDPRPLERGRRQNQGLEIRGDCCLVQKIFFFFQYQHTQNPLFVISS
jgi:hypothetical protein